MIQQRVFEGEQRLRRPQWPQVPQIDQSTWSTPLRRHRCGLQRLQRHGGDIIHRHQLDPVPRALRFRLGFHEDVTAVAAALAPFRAKVGLDGPEFVDEAGSRVMALVGLLGRGRGAAPALRAEALDGGGVGGGVEDAKALGGVASFAHGVGAGGILFAVAAAAGVEAHQPGEVAGGAVVEPARGGEERVFGLGGGELGFVEGLEGGEGCVCGVSGVRVPWWWLLLGGGIGF